MADAVRGAQRRARFAAVADVDWIESAENYVCLHAGTESSLLRETMNLLEAPLQEAQFVRIHRTLLVNARHIREVSAWATENTKC